MDIILNMLWTIEKILFLWGIVQLRFHKNKLRLAIGAVIVIVSRIIKVYSPDIDVAMIVGTIIGPMVGVSLLFDGKYIKGMVKYWFAFFYIDFIYLPIELILTEVLKIFSMDISGDMESFIRNVLVIAVMIWLSYIIKKKRNIVEWIRELPTGYFVIACICGISISGIGNQLGHAIEDASRRVKNTMLVLKTILSIFVYMLGIGFALADFLRKRYKEENAIKDQYLAMSKVHYNGLVAHMQEVRRIKHDMQMHLNILNQYADNENWQSLNEYLKSIIQQSAVQSKKIISVGNEVVDAVIADGINKGSIAEIKIECKGKLPAGLNIIDYDLCTIFSNLLSNAIEACKKLEVREKKIEITIEDMEDEIRISFENPIEWELDVNRLGAYTSKKDKLNHGYGISNVKRAVEKNSGKMVMGVENNIFKTVIIFYK